MVLTAYPSWRQHRIAKPDHALLAGRRLLIVEDEYLVAADLEDLLERQGATVVGTASSVRRGFELLDATRPDAAILDLSLGGEVSAPLAGALVERMVPFVIVTGYGDSWITFPVLHGAPVVEKPVDGAQLLRLLHRALSGR